MITVNLVLKMTKEELVPFEEYLKQYLEVIDVKVLPNTEQLYNDSKPFQRLVKKVKTAQRERDLFINEYNL